MSRKFLACTMVVLMGLLFTTVGLLTAADSPESVLLEYPFKDPKRGPVKLNHNEHVKYGVACNECHHVYKDGVNVWKEGDPVQKCSECHLEESADEKVLNFQNAMHKNCKDCHRDLEKEGKPTGPWKKCNDCHQPKA
jgi:hypothetical protein